MDIKELAKQEIKDLEGTYNGSINTLMEFKREGFVMGYEAAIYELTKNLDKVGSPLTKHRDELKGFKIVSNENPHEREYQTGDDCKTIYTMRSGMDQICRALADELTPTEIMDILDNISEQRIDRVINHLKNN